MSKRIALALIACAGLGFVAGRTPVLPTDSRRSEPAPAETLDVRSESQPVEPSWVRKNARPIPAPPAQTPLVEKLLVKEPAVVKESLTVQGGQLSPGGNFRFSAARNAWIPVDKGNRRYTENGHAPTAEHLIREHGHARSSAEKWTQSEREIAHANSHWWEKRQAAVRQQAYRAVVDSACPGGVCGNSSRLGLFGRRR